MNQPSTQPISEQVRRKRIALAISLITGIMFLLVSVIVGPIAYQANGLDGLWGIGLAFIVSISAFAGAIQVSREHVTRGIGILITTILVMALALPLVARGQGLALGVMILILVAGISSSTLPSKWATRAIISALIIAAIITLADLYLPDFGLPTNPGYTNPIAIITSLVYAFFILRRFNTYTLRTKIIIAFILITVIPLVVLSIFNARSTSNALEAQSKEQLTALAKIVADKVDGFIANQLNSIRTSSKQFALVSYLELPPQSRAGSEEEKNARLALSSFILEDPVFIHSVALLDLNGKSILDTFDEYQGRDESYFPYFSRPVKTGLPYASNIIFRNNKGKIYFTAPVKSQDGKIIGVLRMEYYATVIQSIIHSTNPGNSDTIISLVDSNTYLRVGYTGNRDSLFKPYKNFTHLELVALEADGRLPLDLSETTPVETDNATVIGIDNLKKQPFFNSQLQALGSDAVNTGVFLKTEPWIAMIRQSTNTYLIPVREQNKINTLISVLLIGFSVGVGFITSQFLTAPLTSLTKTAEKITSGDLSARAQSRTEDEIGTLASAFNRMTDQLNQTLLGLEQRVAERTTDLEVSRQQSVKRANELQSIGEISKIITGEQKLETLLPLITRLVSERFNFYHTGIFLVDDTNQYAVLQAANSTGGKSMLERGHKLEVGGSGIVGYVAQSGSPRISLDVGQDAVYFNNPDLPNTRSEMALPLKVHDRIVGVLDVQSERPGAFTENDANTLSILADQIAISLENAKLFTQTQEALSESQALYRQNLQESWRSFSREKEFIGYQQSLTSGKKLTQLVESDEIRQAMNRGEVLIFHADGVTQEASIVVPIKLRGQIIGSINIKAPSKNRQWSTDESNLAETISERLSIALENARLIQESQRQAIKEQTISEVTGKIGASINLKNVLQTAVEELGRALPGSEVIIKFEQKNGNAEQQ
jgi:GAF domain-containing protein/HAMP domain-containing protein